MENYWSNAKSRAQKAKDHTLLIARNDVFSFAVKVLRKAEKIKGSKIRLIVVGDFFQLPPVVPKTEKKMLTKFGYHESGCLLLAFFRPFHIFLQATSKWLGYRICNFKGGT